MMNIKAILRQLFYACVYFQDSVLGEI